MLSISKCRPVQYFITSINKENVILIKAILFTLPFFLLTINGYKIPRGMKNTTFKNISITISPVSYTHLRAHETN